MSIYLAALIFGGIFLVPMMLGSLDFDADVDFDFDGDLDADLDVDFDTDAGGALGDFLGSLISFRSLVFFAAFFGLTGLVADSWLGYASAVALPLAIALGAVAAVSNSTLMGMLKRNMSDSSVTNREIAGSRATVVVPLSEDRRGRVRALVGGQETYLVALPHKSENSFNAGDAVVVVQIENGTALVAPLPGLGSGERE